MHLVLVLTTVALLTGYHCASVSKELHLLSEIDNNIEPEELPELTTRTPRLFRRFVALVKQPLPIYAHAPGDTIRLTCEAVGAPAPSVRWFKNDEPIYEHDMESNDMEASNPTSIGRVKSTLLVTRSSEHSWYSCVASGGPNIKRATTFIYSTDMKQFLYSSTDGSTETSERSKLYPLAPEIVVNYRVLIDTIGSSVVLPCTVKGHPRPHVTWTDNRDRPVKNDHRMQVLRSGELVISSLRWPDAGTFTCHATNSHGTATIETFIYPAKPAWN